MGAVEHLNVGERDVKGIFTNNIGMYIEEFM